MKPRGSEPRRPDRHALLEMRALLDRIIDLRDDGTRARFDAEDEHRWVIHRLWIAIGNEAVASAAAVGLDAGRTEPWSALRRFRNDLAHRRLTDIDEDAVWRTTQLRSDILRDRLEDLIRSDVPAR